MIERQSWDPATLAAWLDARSQQPWLWSAPAAMAQRTSQGTAPAEDSNRWDSRLWTRVAHWRSRLPRPAAAPPAIESSQSAQGHRVVFIADPLPQEFLAKVLAASSAGWTIALGDAAWGDLDWQQVHQCIHPDVWWATTPVFAPAVSAAPLARSPSLPRLPADLTTPEIWIPTGGSSGTLKFARHTWETLAAAVAGFQQHFEQRQINCYCLLPLHHVSGLMQALRSLLTGGRLCLHSFREFQAQTLTSLPTGLSAQSESPPPSPAAVAMPPPQDWFISLVPTQLQRALQAGDREARSRRIAWLQECRAILLGGAPAWPRLLEECDRLHLPIALTYGMTETAAQIATLTPAEFRAGQRHCGRLLPHVQVQCHPCGDREDAAPAQPAQPQPGYLRIHSPSLARGYIRPATPEATGDRTDPAGFQADGFQPDDLGYVDAAGCLHILGRHSNKIITGGENVYPEPIEQVILSTGWVADVAIAGLPDPDWGQRVTAFYVPWPGSAAAEAVPQASAPPASLEAQLRDAIAAQLSPAQRPKQWISVQRLPRTPQGKLRRSDLPKLLPTCRPVE